MKTLKPLFTAVVVSTLLGAPAFAPPPPSFRPRLLY